MLYIRLIIVFSLSLLLGNMDSRADKLDSLRNRHDTLTIMYFKSSLDSLSMGKSQKVNTTRVAGMQRYNPLRKDKLFYGSLGNVGLAYNDLVYKPVLNPGVLFGRTSFDKYTFKNDQAVYYMNNIPVSYLGYVNGSQQEQLFRVVYSQPLGDNFVFGVDFHVINSPGHYTHQKSDDKSLIVTGQYLTSNLRYGIIANFSSNKFIVQENGGITHDSIFEGNYEPYRRSIDVNLKTAENLVKDAGVLINQYFFLSGGSRTQIDTSTGEPVKKFHLGRLAHQFSFDKQHDLYQDTEPTNPFYQSFDHILDSTQTRDSVLFRRFTNKLSWSNLGVRENPLEKKIIVNFAISYQYAEMSGYAEKEHFNLLIPAVDITLRPTSSTQLDLNGNYTFGDFNAGGYYLNGTLIQYFRGAKNEFGALQVRTSLIKQEKGYFFNTYYSNYLRWNNKLKQEETFYLDARYLFKGFNAGASFYDVKNMVYLNERAKPLQHMGNLTILQAYLYWKFHFGVWHLDNKFIYQKVSHEDILRLPALAANVSFYATLSLFGNAAILQPGLDFWYNTAYHADAYMPAIRSFYLQNEKTIGNHLYADVYVNLMIKTFRIFLKYSHFNSFFGNYNYYMVPHYPMQDASLRFGISWTFYN